MAVSVPTHRGCGERCTRDTVDGKLVFRCPTHGVIDWTAVTYQPIKEPIRLLKNASGLPLD